MNCPHCQTVNPEQAKFCMNCGSPLADPDSSPVITYQGQPKAAFLHQYLPSDLISKLEAARARSDMLGERRVITMLFCDVKGSTSAAEQVDPEIWTDIMNGVFETMIRPIYKYEGLVPRLMGDAILAFFGAPIAHEDDPRRAVLAGLEIQRGFESYAQEIRHKFGLEFGLRIGVNTGLVVVGEIGSDLRMEYTAIGDAINLAARMEQTARVGTIQISEHTQKLVAPFFDLESLGEVEVKGKSAPVNTYRVLGTKSEPARSRGLEGLSSPLVGREAQLSQLQECCSKLNEGKGSFVLVTGEAGLGKSSLIAELRKSHEKSRISWLKGDSLSYTRSISYYPWRQIIRQSIDAREEDSPAEIRRKLEYVCDCCTLPGGDLPFLEAMLSVESEQSLQTLTGFQGESFTQRMVEATRGYLCGLSIEDPLAIVFDDLHWADEASLNLIHALADLPKSQAVMLVCMLRPEKSTASWDAMNRIQETTLDGFHFLHLDPLGTGGMNELVTNLLGMQDLPQAFREMILEKAGGNPYFIEELIRSLIETNQLIRVEDQWQATGDAPRTAVPDTLRGVLSARIDRLPDATRDVLQNAAVIGRSFDMRVLEQLVGVKTDPKLHVQALQEANLVEPLDEAYTFRHVLIQEAAYESILIKRRTDLHRRIAEIMEGLYAGRVEEFAPLLAHHYSSARDGRSLEYDILAGEKAARLFANAEAATHFTRALETAVDFKADADKVEKLYTRLGSVLELSGRHDQALVKYDDMLAFGREQGRPAIELNALMAKATIYSIFSQLHNSELSERLLIEALDLSRQIGETAVQARLNWNLMVNYLFSKRFEQSLQHGLHALELARAGEDREQLAFILNDLCRLHTCRGEFDEAHLVVKEARALWQSLDNQVMLADSLGSEAEVRFNSGDFDGALECNRQAIQICEKTDNLWGQSYNSMLMSFVHLESGRIGSGIQLAERSFHIADRTGLIASSMGLRSELAWIYAYCGENGKGRQLIEEALLLADTKQPAWRAFPQACKVRMHLLQGDLPSARQTAGNSPLLPISIPYARYTILICLANIELSFANGAYEESLNQIEELLNEVLPQTRVDIPEVLRWKGESLLALGRLDEAHRILIEARSRAESLGADPQLWPILICLARFNTKSGDHQEAEANLAQARLIVERIGDSLAEIGLRDSFIRQAGIRLAE